MYGYEEITLKEEENTFLQIRPNKYEDGVLLEAYQHQEDKNYPYPKCMWTVELTPREVHKLVRALRQQLKANRNRRKQNQTAL